MAVNLDGCETSIVKALGFGSETDGKALIERLGNLGESELIDSLHSLIRIGYVDCDKTAIDSFKDIEGAHFCINSGYSRELKDSLEPAPSGPKSRRVRRE